MHDICHSYVNVSIYITEFAVNISDLWFMTTKKVSPAYSYDSVRID